MKFLSIILTFNLLFILAYSLTCPEVCFKNTTHFYDVSQYDELVYQKDITYHINVCGPNTTCSNNSPICFIQDGNQYILEDLYELSINCLDVLNIKYTGYLNDDNITIVFIIECSLDDSVILNITYKNDQELEMVISSPMGCLHELISSDVPENNSLMFIIIVSSITVFFILSMLILGLKYALKKKDDEIKVSSKKFDDIEMFDMSVVNDVKHDASDICNLEVNLSLQQNI